MEKITSPTHAAQFLQTSRQTITSWQARGILTAPPWTRGELREAKKRAKPRFKDPADLTHGLTGWVRGCRCDICTHAHSRADTDRRRRRREEWWQENDREARVLALLADGVPYAEALEETGTTWQALHRRAERHPDFAEKLDQALMDGRPSQDSHGTARAWKSGCRCPECRDYSRSTR